MLDYDPLPKVITFDCYGTLVQRHQAVRPGVREILRERLLVDPSDDWSIWIDRLGETLNPAWTPEAALKDLSGLPDLLIRQPLLSDNPSLSITPDRSSR